MTPRWDQLDEETPGDWDRPRIARYACSDALCGADDCRTCRPNFVPDTGDDAQDNNN